MIPRGDAGSDEARFEGRAFASSRQPEAEALSDEGGPAFAMRPKTRPKTGSAWRQSLVCVIARRDTRLQMLLANRQRQLPEIIAIQRQDVERVQLYCSLCRRECRTSKSGMPWKASSTGPPSMMNWRCRLFAASKSTESARIVA